jgi:hypothetical protein
VAHQCNFDALNAIYQAEFVEVGGGFIVTANYPNSGDANIK